MQHNGPVTRPRARLVVAVVLAAVAAAQVLLAGGRGFSALAQTSCGAVEIGAQVTIDSPRAGPVTSPFVVSGRAVSTLALSRVDLLVGGTVVASKTYPPATSLDFEFSVGPSQAPVGARSLSAVACGAGLSLVRGESSSVVVDVRLPATTTFPPTSAPVVVTAPPAVPSTTAVAAPLVGASTTSTSKPLAKKNSALPAPSDREAPADPEGLADTSAEAAADRPVRLTDGDQDNGSDRPPLWVGAVVGLSGLAGLTLSGLVRRRSNPQRGLPVDTAGPLSPPADPSSLGDPTRPSRPTSAPSVPA